MNELNPTNAFGELLLDLIEAQYEGDIDAGIEAIMGTTGLEEDEVVAIVQGDTIVEDESLLSDIVDAFPDADEDDLEVIINTATGVEAEDREALVSEIDANEQDMEEGEVEEAEYGFDSVAVANFSADQRQLHSKVARLQDQLASFQYTSALSTELSHLDSVTTQYVGAGLLPPSYKSMLIGNFSDDSQRVARFSQIAQDNGVDVDTMLFAAKYALGMITDAAQYVDFKDYSLSDEDVAVANFSANLDSIVQADIEAIFNN